MVRTGEWFYAYNAFGGEVLFDIQDDPDELNNIVEAAGSAALSEMRALALERSLSARPSARLEARY
jgi:hypothetical protein